MDKKELQEYFDLEITLCCRHTQNYLKNYDINKFIKNLDYDSKEESIGKRFKGLNFEDSKDHLQAISQEIQKKQI